MKVLVVRVSRPDPINGYPESFNISPIGPFNSKEECEQYFQNHKEKIQAEADKYKCFKWDAVEILDYEIETILEP